ncbi:MAG: CvpA family protein [Gammaproteobacteria bacterium]|nr:CvpA family protein [Gammaproteobacteria bacterium]
MITILDLIIVIIVSVSVLIGIFRGFIRESLSLISWIISFSVAFLFAETGSVYFEPYIGAPAIRIVATFATLFIVTLIVTSFASFLLYRLFAATGIAGTDRALGGMFGLARAAVLIAAFVLFAGLTVMPQQPWWRQSLLVGFFEPVAMLLGELLPADIARQLGYG